MRILCTACALSALFVAGCNPTPPNQAQNFGRFDGEVVAVWDINGRHMTLRENFAYIDPQNRVWHAPAGAVIDGASIPVAFWSVIGGPFEGPYRNASVVHDVGCLEMTAPWQDVHGMFYDACRCGGVDETKAKLMYYAVYHFGPRWQPVTESRIETTMNADGQVVQQEVMVPGDGAARPATAHRRRGRAGGGADCGGKS